MLEMLLSSIAFLSFGAWRLSLAFAMWKGKNKGWDGWDAASRETPPQRPPVARLLVVRPPVVRPPLRPFASVRPSTTVSPSHQLPAASIPVPSTPIARAEDPAAAQLAAGAGAATEPQRGAEGDEVTAESAAVHLTGVTGAAKEQPAPKRQRGADTDEAKKRASNQCDALHEIAQTAIMEFAVDPIEQPCRVQVVSILPDPENRDGKWMVSKDVMDLIFKILNLKFSIFINEVGIIVQVLPARSNKIIRHYSNMTQGDPMMPPYLPDVDPVMYTSLHTSHFICACRCFWYGAQDSEAVKAKGVCDQDGRLSMERLKVVSPQWHAYITNGVRCIRLNKSIMSKEHLMRAIQASQNTKSVLGETEMQLWETLRDRMFHQDSDPSRVSCKTLAEEVTPRFWHLKYIIEEAAKFTKA